MFLFLPLEWNEQAFSIFSHHHRLIFYVCIFVKKEQPSRIGWIYISYTYSHTYIWTYPWRLLNRSCCVKLESHVQCLPLYNKMVLLLVLQSAIIQCYVMVFSSMPCIFSHKKRRKKGSIMGAYIYTVLLMIVWWSMCEWCDDDGGGGGWWEIKEQVLVWRKAMGFLWLVINVPLSHSSLTPINYGLVYIIPTRP